MAGRAVTLGKQQRALLLEASNRPVAIVQPGLDREAIRRRREAAAALERLGLAEIVIAQSPQTASSNRPVKMISLTAIGRELVQTFDDELRRGTRIRWAEKGWRAAYVHHEAEAPPVPVPANDASPRQSSRIWAALTFAAAAILTRAA